jgi:hypothetical protein
MKYCIGLLLMLILVGGAEASVTNSALKRARGAQNASTVEPVKAQAQRDFCASGADCFVQASSTVQNLALVSLQRDQQTLYALYQRYNNTWRKVYSGPKLVVKDIQKAGVNVSPAVLEKLAKNLK